MTLGEIAKGIAILRRRDRDAATRLQEWLLGLKESFADRILPVDDAVAVRWGALSAERTLPVVDGLLAATAIVHDLTLVTRNTADVTNTGVRLLNPWAP